jgi:hypothetical protein
MIIKVTMKTPDAMSEAIKDAVAREMPVNMDEDERQEMFDERVEQAETVLRQWFRWGEILDISFDTETKTATVEKAGN